MRNVQFKLRAVNVPKDLQHMRRADELQQVIDYLRVDATSAANLAMVHMGTAAPSLDQSDLLWVKRTPDGLPAGLFLQSLGQWVRATPHTVESETTSLQIRTGTGTLTHSETADNPKLTQITTFTPEFEAVPLVFVSILGGTMYTTAANYATWNYKIVPAKDKWEIEVKSTQDCSSASKTIEFAWMAIGAVSA